MSVGTEKTSGVTPAEYADQIQGEVRGQSIDAFQAAVATGILGSVVVERPGRIRGIVGKILTTGSSGTTSLDVKKIPKGSTTPATVFSATLDLANTDPDGTEFNHVDFIDDDAGKVEPGDVVYLEETAASTGGLNLHAQVAVDDRFDPPAERPLLS